ncbi:hypothetical protein CEXT_182111 [Caerostris extrusa]|uniref:Uncharacterized protein n=1 Tax=Caerostris extrusa TaxID=172846 RepID=A0AAV4Y5S7_CAEEX|nr:hypothetical protein CEXT_182111 [Caerostris extrusa]
MPPDPCSTNDPCFRNILRAIGNFENDKHVVGTVAEDHGKVGRDLAGVEGILHLLARPPPSLCYVPNGRSPTFEDGAIRKFNLITLELRRVSAFDRGLIKCESIGTRQMKRFVLEINHHVSGLAVPKGYPFIHLIKKMCPVRLVKIPSAVVERRSCTGS